MKKITYEIRYMLLMLMSVLEQKPMQPMRSRIYWGDILKAADFQNILGIIYCGMLGVEKEITEGCKELFYQKYKRELLLNSSYQNAEETIIWKMEQEGIHALLLYDCFVSDLYENENLLHIGEIEILIEREDFFKVRKMMLQMDYEEKEDRLGNGHIYTRQPGIQVVIYETFPTDNKIIGRYFDDPVKTYECIPGYRYIHGLLKEEKYIYYFNRLFTRYICGLLKVRDLLDFWQFKKKIADELPLRRAENLFGKAKLWDFFLAVEELQLLWFGKAAARQEKTVLDLEYYILIPDSSPPDETLIPNKKVRMDFYKRDREAEWTEKKRTWIFPPKDYMVQYFPILEKLPFLLPVFWLWRYLRTLKRVWKRKWKEFREKTGTRIAEAKEEIHLLFVQLSEKLPSFGKEKQQEQEAEESISEETDSPELIFDEEASDEEELPEETESGDTQMLGKEEQNA